MRIWALLVLLCFIPIATGQQKCACIPAPVNNNIVFGLAVNNLSSEPNQPATPAIVYQSKRLWDTGTTWKDIDTNGTFNFISIDHWLAKVPAGVDVMYTFAKVPTDAGGGTSFANPPSDIATGNARWKGFVTALVTRYKGKIAAYELWNEPNAIGTYWNGTIPQMAQMASDAATIIRSIDPAAKLVSPAPSSGPTLVQPAPWLQSYLNAGGPMDVVAFHSSYDIPTDVTIINAIKAVTSKEFWVTEGSWGPTGNSTFTDAQKQAFIPSQYQTFQALGIKRYYWYAYDNQTLGTLEIGGALTPAGQTYSNLAGGTPMSNSTVKVPVPAVQPPAVTPPSITPPAVPVSIVDSTKNGINAALVGTTLTITDSGVVPPPIVIGIGSKVQTIAAANVRKTAGGTSVGQQPANAQGVVTDGPQTANGFPWWNVNFANPPSGWVGADNLELANPTLPQS